MKTLKIIGLLTLLVAVGAGAFFVGKLTRPDHGAATATQEKTLYTCGMHPQVIQDHPGNCPICGMKLTPIRKQAGATQEAGADLGTIAIDPVTIQDMGVRTGVVTRGPLRRTIRTVGVVNLDESAVADVTTKFKGWAEKLYVDTTGQLVMRGDPLLEIYSPDLYSAQTEYLLALGSSPTPDASLEALRTSARLKLKFWDISDAQIAELEKSRTPRKTLRLNAPRDGFVMDKSVVEGQMVDAGMKLYRIADLGLVWVQSEIYEQDLPFIKLGQEATVSLSYLPDRKFRGRVTYIYPTVDEKTRTAKVRMEFHNPGYFLKPGMFASVEITSELAPSVVLVPDTAVLRSGERNTVFVALDGGKFAPRAVTLGPRAEGNFYEVITGLEAGERVVTSGQFMLDSESQLREAIQKMMEPGATATVVGSNPPPARPVSLASGTNAGQPAIYICPMPAHVSIQYDHPGKCPICGMTLVPVTPGELQHLRPGGRVLYYTCPMPEHADVRSDKPGKCPKCGMTLIPVMEVPQSPAEPAAPPTAATERTQALPPVLYTCPMASHADVVSDKPGQCPKCGMSLVPTSTVKHGRIAEANWQKAHAK
jgi:RND family efflux transporter MFP subunit